MEKKTKEQLDRELLLLIHTLVPDEEIKIIKDRTGKINRLVINARKTTILEYD